MLWLSLFAVVALSWWWCCGCGPTCSACSGTVPEEIEVVIASTGNENCTGCSNWDGTWITTIDATTPIGTPDCVWGYELTSGEYSGLKAWDPVFSLCRSAVAGTKITVEMDVVGSDSLITVWLSVAALFGASIIRDNTKFEKLYLSQTTINCAGLSSESIDAQTTVGGCNAGTADLTAL